MCVEILVLILDREYIAPVVAYLCHSSCKSSGLSGLFVISAIDAPSGQVFEIGAGYSARLRWQRSVGLRLSIPDGKNTLEEVAKGWDKVNDFHNPTYPKNTDDVIKYMVSPSRGVNRSNVAFHGFKSHEVDIYPLLIIS
jgi:hypothetical protein